MTFSPRALGRGRALGREFRGLVLVYQAVPQSPWTLLAAVWPSVGRGLLVQVKLTLAIPPQLSVHLVTLSRYQCGRCWLAWEVYCEDPRSVAPTAGSFR